jgi:hypothetical protein
MLEATKHGHVLATYLDQFATHWVKEFTAVNCTLVGQQRSLSTSVNGCPGSSVQLTRTTSLERAYKQLSVSTFRAIKQAMNTKYHFTLLCAERRKCFFLPLKNIRKKSKIIHGQFQMDNSWTIQMDNSWTISSPLTERCLRKKM